MGKKMVKCFCFYYCFCFVSPLHCPPRIQLVCLIRVYGKEKWKEIDLKNYFGGMRGIHPFDVLDACFCFCWRKGAKAHISNVFVEGIEIELKDGARAHSARVVLIFDNDIRKNVENAWQPHAFLTILSGEKSFKLRWDSHLKSLVHSAIFPIRIKAIKAIEIISGFHFMSFLKNKPFQEKYFKKNKKIYNSIKFLIPLVLTQTFLHSINGNTPPNRKGSNSKDFTIDFTSNYIKQVIPLLLTKTFLHSINGNTTSKRKGSNKYAALRKKRRAQEESSSVVGSQAGRKRPGDFPQDYPKKKKLKYTIPNIGRQTPRKRRCSFKKWKLTKRIQLSNSAKYCEWFQYDNPRGNSTESPPPDLQTNSQSQTPSSPIDDQIMFEIPQENTHTEILFEIIPQIAQNDQISTENFFERKSSNFSIYPQSN